MTEKKPTGLLYAPSRGGLPGIEDRHYRRLAAEMPGIDWRLCRDGEEFLAALPDAAAAIVWRFKREWLERGGSLRLVATPAAGKDWIDIRSRPGLDVLFGSFHGVFMAETVLGMMLAFTRCIKLSLDRQAVQPWARQEIAGAMRPLRGSRAVVLGFGNIGKWIGRLLKPMGVGITGVNRANLERPAYFGPEDAVVRVDDLDRVLPECDHLVAALPGEDTSANVVDAGRLALLPRGAYVYNIGRGNAIAMDALVDALRSGALGGAGLDVYDKEPLPVDHPIRTCPNVILMPHVSAFASNYMDLYLDELLPRMREVFATGGRPKAGDQ